MSSVAILAYLSGVQTEATGFLGLKFNGLEQIWLQIALFSVVVYLFLQFVWQMWDYIQFSKLRITGTRVSHVTTARYGSEHGDYPDDPIQSTLYQWWSTQAEMIGNLSQVADELHRVAGQLEEAAQRPGNMEQPNINHVQLTGSQINKDAAKLGRQIEAASKAITAERIPISLKRFDAWFRRFRVSQVCRMVVLDMAIPVILGLAGICLTFLKVWPPLWAWMST